MPAFKDRTGEVLKMNNDLMATIISYRGSMDIDIEFENGVIVRNRTYGSFLRGSIKCPLLINYIDDYAEIINPNIDECKWIMDIEDLHLLENYLWCIDSNGYVVRGTKIELLHRIIMNAKEKEYVLMLKTLEIQKNKKIIQVDIRV